ncbi:MAG: tetratricopeptide repeat protein [Balneola sp.]
MDLQNLISELKRRNVFRVATAYAIAGWLIIQISATTFPYLNLPEWLITAVIIFVLIGFPLAIIFTWAFELTPEGIERSKDVEITESVTASTGKKLNKLIIGALSFGLIFLLVERIFFAQSTIFDSDSSKIENASIAVLPFVNMSSDQSNEYFSDGLSEELLNGLANIEGMQVAGRTSSFSFKNKNEDLRVIAEQLGVKHILEGSVRKDGDQIRITAQLVQADNGFHLWSETYDRELESIFAIQEEISRKVVQELKVRLLPVDEVEIAKRPTEDIEAYNTFLKATQLEVSRSPEDLETAITLYEQAIEIDPTFTEAYARLAIAYGLLNQYGNLSFAEMLEKMDANINKALLINPNLGIVYRALGFYQNQRLEENALVAAENAYRKAIELTPNDAYAYNSLYIAIKSRSEEEAYRYLEKAYQLDPLSNPIAVNYASFLLVKKEYEKGIELLDKVIARAPDYTSAHRTKISTLALIPNGDLDKAFITAHKALKQNPESLEILSLIVELSSDMDLIPVRKYYSDKMLELYPSNFDAIGGMLETQTLMGQSELALSTMDAMKTQFGPQAEKFMTSSYSSNLFILGRNEEILVMIDKHWPEIANKTYDFDSYNNDLLKRDALDLVFLYATVLIDEGKEKEAQFFINSICEDYSTKNQDKETTDSYLAPNDLWMSMNCSLINGNVEEGIDQLNEYYFLRKGKRGYPLAFLRDVFLLYKDHPEMIKTKELIFEDLHGMRNEVIIYLKEENEWKEEWAEN